MSGGFQPPISADPQPFKPFTWSGESGFGSSGLPDTPKDAPPPPQPPTSTDPTTIVKDGYVWQQVPAVDPLTGLVSKTKTTWKSVGVAPKSVTGAGSSFNDQLDAAKAAVSDYLQASSLSDARKLNAFQEMQKIAQYALPAGATQFPGYEQGGLGHALAAQLGMKSFTPPPMTPIQMSPSALGTPGAIDPTAMSMIDRILGAAGARGGASNGAAAG